MSLTQTMLVLKLFIEHGIWNESDHDIFKTIISSCRELYSYVFQNKSLQKRLVKSLSYFVVSKQLDHSSYAWMKYWIIGRLQEGLQITYYYGSSKIYEIVNYHNGLREGMCIEYDFDHQQKRTQCFYKQGQLVVSK